MLTCILEAVEFIWAILHKDQKFLIELEHISLERKLILNLQALKIQKSKCARVHYLWLTCSFIFQPIRTSTLMYCFSPFNPSPAFLDPFYNSGDTDFFKNYLLIHKPTVLCTMSLLSSSLDPGMAWCYLHLAPFFCMSPERATYVLVAWPHWQPNSFTLSNLLFLLSCHA